ncbi:MAG: cupin domain-containing protein [Pseudomonadota bacterium]|nr:cupin domain-containing protein [Pseudomonadota bacterium]
MPLRRLLLAACIPMLAIAQTPPQSAALAKTFEDLALQWGPCPAFLPEGCAIAVLHGDPSKDNADVFFKLPGKSDVARHWHTSAERMVLISGELHVTYDGQDTAILRPGTYAYGPAKLPHAAKCVSEAPCVLAIAFESPVDAIASEDR